MQDRETPLLEQGIDRRRLGRLMIGLGLASLGLVACSGDKSGSGFKASERPFWTIQDQRSN